MMFSIFILAMVIAVIWRVEYLNASQTENDKLHFGAFEKLLRIAKDSRNEVDELKAFVDKHVKNKGIEEYKRLTQESIERQLQEAACKSAAPDTTLELVVSTIEAPKKKVANKRRKKK